MKHAIALHRAGQFNAAEVLYKEVLECEGEHPEALHNLGAALAQQGQPFEALNYLTRASALDSKNPKLLLVLTRVLVATGDFGKAHVCCRKLLTLQPTSAASHYLLGDIQVRLGNAAEAAKSYRVAIQLAPAGAAASHNNLGNLHKLEGRLDAAMDSYRAALGVDPRYISAHFNLGTVLEQKGQLSEAVQCFHKVIELQPSHPDVYRQLGAILLERGQVSKGLEAFLHHARSSASTAPVTDTRKVHDMEQEAFLGRKLGDRLTLSGGTRVIEHAINPNHAPAVEDRWRKSDPKLVVVDDLLSAAALAELRQLCLSSNIWKLASPNGYLGTSPEHGFAAPLLAQIGEELPAAFPQIFGNHPLLQLWAFKYGDAPVGVSLHADFAAINVNFWITPDEANLEPASGGLIVWDKSAPLDWDFDRYNTDQNAIKAYLKASGANKIHVPYRANRAVIFDSDLFHETDRLLFKRGYQNRRINITFLYGWRNGEARN